MNSFGEAPQKEEGPAVPCPLDPRAIKRALDLADVARCHTRLRRAGRQWVGLCPLHRERHPSFYVDSRRWYCFGCQRGGDLFAFIMAVERCAFPEAMRRSAEFLNESGGRRLREAGGFCRPTEGAEGGEAPSCRRSRQALIARMPGVTLDRLRAQREAHRQAVNDGARRALIAREAELPPCMRAEAKP
jgi:hypothetical protein